jgi:hypothetical protein
LTRRMRGISGSSSSSGRACSVYPGAGWRRWSCGGWACCMAGSGRSLRW